MVKGENRKASGVAGASVSSGAGLPDAGGGSEYVLSLEDVGKSSGAMAGRKAASLGELAKEGFHVPQGFVLTTKAFDRFFESGSIKEEINRILSGVNVSDVEGLKHASADIINIILKTSMPNSIRAEVRDAYEELSIGREIKGVKGPALDMIKAGRSLAVVAVRSSVVSDESGSNLSLQLGSRLGVHGNDALYDAIKACWAGLFSSHVIFYMKDQGIGSFPKMGLIIQKMIDPDKSGVMMTTDPACNNSEHMVVEASWGYGDSITAGLVIPDEYVLDKESGSIRGKRIGKKKWTRKLNQVSGHISTENTDRSLVSSEVMSENELKRLLEIGKRIESHLGVPQEIRWSAEKGRLYMMRTAPVPANFFPTNQLDAGSGPEASTGIGGKQLIEGAGVSPGSVTGTARVVSGPEDMGRLAEGDVLVAKTITPPMIPLLRNASAIITNDGGKTCYAAVVSREFGIPCIVGTDMATSVLKDGQNITIEASDGRVYENAETAVKPSSEAGPGSPETPDVPAIPESAVDERPEHDIPGMPGKTDMPETGRKGTGEAEPGIAVEPGTGGLKPRETVADKNKEIELPENLPVLSETGLPQQPAYAGSSQGAEATSLPGSMQPHMKRLPSMTAMSEKITATGIKVNITFPQSVGNSKDLVGRSDGAGLVRAEHMITESGKHPVFLARTSPEELVEAVKDGLGRVAKAFYPKPVWYRCLDARTDDFRELEGGEEPQEANPMLGWHGTRRSISEPDVFRCELRAIKSLQEAGMDNVSVMLPFVSKVEEVRAARTLMKEAGLHARLGVMVETPAAALKIEELCREGIHFASIGSDTLTQLILAIDRENPRVAGIFSETDPAVLDLIRYVINVCKRYRVETSICGGAGSNPAVVEMLVGLGIDSISTEPDAVDEIRKTAARTERRMLLGKLGKGQFTLS